MLACLMVLNNFIHSCVIWCIIQTALYRYCVLFGFFVIFNSALGVLNKWPYINIVFCLEFLSFLTVY